MQPNHYQLTLIIPYAGTADDASDLMQPLRTLPGVQDAVYEQTEQCIYLRVEKATYQNGSAEKMMHCQ